MPGFTCAVPGCMNNSAKHKHLKFFVFPKDKKLREQWLLNINRPGKKGSVFHPTVGHRVCSDHFAGGKKTYLNRIPTIFPVLPPKKVKAKKPVSTPSSCPVKSGDTGINANREVVICTPDHSYSLPSEESDVATLQNIVREKNKMISNLLCEIQNLKEELKELKEQLADCENCSESIAHRTEIEHKDYMI